MRRTLVQLDEETYRKLRERAFQQERSVSSVVREMVAKGLGDAERRRRTRASQFLSVGAGSSKQGKLSPVSERHDDALAKTFDK
jgi:plasmid stability protein